MFGIGSVGLFTYAPAMPASSPFNPLDMPPRTPTARPESNSVGWSETELANPHMNDQKSSKVRGMFTSIADSYDLNNRLHSLWMDQHWRRAAVRDAAVKAGDVVADLACGTGDLSMAFAESAAARVVGLDYTAAMLEVARRKSARLSGGAAGKVTYVEADAHNLPVADGSVDVVSIAFGIRNVTDPARVTRECARILRAGGRIVILEFVRPINPVLRWLNDVYCGQVMPRTATLISGDKSGAYKYLPRSVSTFMEPLAMEELLRNAGFGGVSSRSLFPGICRSYRAMKP